MTKVYKRSFRNFLIDPNFQIKYALYFASTGMTAIGILFLIMTFKMNQILDVLPSMNGDSSLLEEALTSVTYDISLFMLITLLATIVFSIGFAIYMTHRVSGAAFVIEKYIRELESGNYEASRSLRKSDDLQAIMVALKDLAETLKSKQKLG